MSYAVEWSEDDGPVYAGRLELAPGAVHLTGAARAVDISRRRLSFDELADVHVERGARARLLERPTLVLEERNGSRIRLVSVDGVGSLNELVERLDSARGDTHP